MSRLFFLGLLAFLQLNLSAQDNSENAEYPVGGEHEFAVHGAYNSSFISDNGFTPVDGQESAGGISLGAQYEYVFSKNWVIKARVSYDYKGTKNESTELYTDLHYLTMPVMASWHFGTLRRWYLHFGLYTGILLDARLRDDDRSFSVKDAYDSFDYGSDIGVGVRIPAKKGKWFFIEMDFQNSYTDPAKVDVPDVTTVRSTLGVGLIF